MISESEVEFDFEQDYVYLNIRYSAQYLHLRELVPVIKRYFPFLIYLLSLMHITQISFRESS